MRDRPAIPTVVAVTVSTNEAAWLPECFGTLSADRTDVIDLRLVLVDNASTDGSADLVAERFPTVTIIRNAVNLGFAGANNVGIAAALEAGAEFVFLVNPDTRTPPGLIADIVTVMRAWPEYGVTGPLQNSYDGDELNDWSRMALDCGEAHVFVHTWPDHRSPAGPSTGRAPDTLEHAYVQGSAMMCRADVLRAVGGFDEIYHTYYEETDLCRRVRWAGWRVALLTNLRIHHAGGGSTGASLYRRRLMLRNKYYFLLTDPEWTWPRLLRLGSRWVLLDLNRRGAAPATTAAAALGDTVLGLCWVLARLPRALRVRWAHTRLRRTGAGGPLRHPDHRITTTIAAGPGGKPEVR